MLTVLGSVASRLGPREVAIGSCVAARAWVGAAVSCREVSDVDAAAGRVSVYMTVTGCAGLAVDVVGAQAARKTTSRPRRVKSRLFLILL